jgi:uncharacterized BrkB/YihY/UPF0761 family membrane protein
VVAVLLWVLGRGVFSLYANQFGDYDATYGTLGG